MKKVLIGVAIALVLAVGGLLGAAALQPDELRVERSATIEATPEQISPLCTDLKAWADWNPWHELDPDMELTYSEPSSGVGASYSWDGNEDAGKGSMKITKIEPHRVEYDLVFEEPFEDTATVIIEFEPEQSDPARTKVTWRMEGENNFMAKIMFLFMDMDALLGADFEKGLKNLAAEVEA